MMDFNGFLTVAKETFPGMTERMESRFRAMEELYNDWNAKINVISRKDIDSLYIRHILHSLAIAAYLKGGDFAEELCKMMKMARLRPGSVRTWKIQDWINDPVFEEKYVIDIPVGSRKR